MSASCKVSKFASAIELIKAISYLSGNALLSSCFLTYFPVATFSEQNLNPLTARLTLQDLVIRFNG